MATFTTNITLRTHWGETLPVKILSRGNWFKAIVGRRSVEARTREAALLKLVNVLDPH
jgi:hypothetical protein